VIRHEDHCNVWVGCQQCDGPDLRRDCTCAVSKLVARNIVDDFPEDPFNPVSFLNVTGFKVLYSRTEPSMDWNPKQDARPAMQDLRLYRRGVWMVEELLVRDELGRVIGKVTAKRVMSTTEHFADSKAALDVGHASGLVDPWPGEEGL
jgi:hypothetical protein